MLSTIRKLVNSCFNSCFKRRQVVVEEVEVPYANEIIVPDKIIYYADAVPLSPELSRLPVAVDYPLEVETDTREPARATISTTLDATRVTRSTHQGATREIPRELTAIQQNRLNAQTAVERERIRVSLLPPLEQLKIHIYQSAKKRAFSVIPELTTEELEEAIVYLNNANQNTPKNKTRPLIRREIQKVLRERELEEV